MMEAGEGRGEAKTYPPGNFINELLTTAAARGLLPAHNLCSTAHLQRLPAPGFHRAASALQREIPFRGLPSKRRVLVPRTREAKH